MRVSVKTAKKGKKWNILQYLLPPQVNAKTDYVSHSLFNYYLNV